MTYADRVSKKPPTTLTEDEQAKLLRVTGEERSGFRDHVIFSFALGTALRLSELCALDVGAVYDGAERARRVVRLTVFKGSKNSERGPSVPQEVFLPDALRRKLAAFWRWKKSQGESLDDDAPLFASRRHDGSRKKRLSARMLEQAFVTWQKKAGLDRHFKFHALRHTSLTNLYRSTRDIRVVQRQARHANIITTTIYAGPSDEDLSQAIEGLQC